MTLIITVLTEHYAVVASDRRVTRQKGGEQILRDDRLTKSAILTGPTATYLVGYTGPTRLGNARLMLDEWLESTLAPLADVSACFPRLKVELQKGIRAVGWPGYTAFNCAGWELSKSGQWTALSRLVHNPYFPNAPVHEIEIETSALTESRSGRHIVPSGEPLSPDAMAWLERHVDAALAADPKLPNLLHTPLLELFSNVAAEAGGRVGRTVSMTSVPRVALPLPLTANVWMNLSPQDFRTNEVSVTYLDPEANPVVDGRLQFVTYHPTLISPGIGSLWGGRSASFASPPDPDADPKTLFLPDPPTYDDWI